MCQLGERATDMKKSISLIENNSDTNINIYTWTQIYYTIIAMDGLFGQSGIFLGESYTQFVTFSVS